VPTGELDATPDDRLPEGTGAAPVGERVGVRHVDVEDRPARAPLGKPAEVLDLEQLGHGWRIPGVFSDGDWCAR